MEIENLKTLLAKTMEEKEEAIRYAEMMVGELERLRKEQKEQKQFLGGILFPLVQRMNTTLTGKITGMLLELPISEILHLLNNRQDLKDMVSQYNHVTIIILLIVPQVEEAVAVYTRHRNGCDGSDGCET